jgi:RNA polymerase sigma-70 factor (ECF subfamily)
MAENEIVTRQFEENRLHLRAVAYRMLGSTTEADDAVQETWLRLTRSDSGNIQNLRAWLTTVIARVCLDMLRSRTSRREDALDTETPEVSMNNTAANSPEQEAILADSVGVALLVVLDQLPPAERLAFVLHDMFDMSFEEIAGIVGRTPAAARQLASRARRRVQGKKPLDTRILGQRRVVDAFLAALRKGDFEGLIAVLDPDVVVRIDEFAGRPGEPREIRGAQNWAKGAITFSQVARFIQPALINGNVGLILAHGGRLSRVLQFAIVGDKIVDVEIIAARGRLQSLKVSVLEN